MQHYLPHLQHIESLRGRMIGQTENWARINSGSYNTVGLKHMLEALAYAFSSLGGTVERIELAPQEVVNARGEIEKKPLGQALRITKRPDAKLKVFLGGHMDTVFPADHPFQDVKTLEGGRLNGPGVADLKGGLSVMLAALETLEQTPWANTIGWEILINPDEEIGSVGSVPLLAEAAKRNHLGLIYEPALADGTLAGARKGSGNFSIAIEGRAAHAGRNIDEGRNAILLASELAIAVHSLHGKQPGVTVNPARIDGGGPLNVVPDHAVLRFNVRVGSHEEQHWVEKQLENIVLQCKNKEGSKTSLYGGFTRPPKVISEMNTRLMKELSLCGNALGFEVHYKDTGGCCDGNNLAAHGLPNVDSLGVRGGNIHSAEEYALIDSFVERAQLSALFLMKLAAGDITWQP